MTDQRRGTGLGDGEERIAALETGQGNLARGLHDLDERVESFAREVRSSLAQITDKIGSSQRTPWATLAAWASVMLMLGGLSFAPVLWRQAKQEENIERLDDRLRAHMADGHPLRVIEWVDRNTSSIDSLDAKLQREMNLIDAKVQTQIQTIDDRMQRETKSLLEAPLERIKALERAVLPKSP